MTCRDDEEQNWEDNRPFNDRHGGHLQYGHSTAPPIEQAIPGSPYSDARRDMTAAGVGSGYRWRKFLTPSIKRHSRQNVRRNPSCTATKVDAAQLQPGAHLPDAVCWVLNPQDV